MIPLGPFDLVAPVARGGMAAVWQARHRAQRTPVAIKVLTSQEGRDPEFLARFRSEVRAVAGLDHPAVVLLFDHGAIPEEAARLAEGLLVAGSPYLVMEWCSGGTLASVPLPSSWPALRDTLTTLIDALAHAHARGVVHRDLKPANVLCGLEGDLRPGLKLADFGVARPREALTPEEGPDAGISGTLPYMAPEQALGRWRDEGPWTDLYSLGCLAWKLLTGSPPLLGDETILFAHLQNRPMARLCPRFPVPAGLERWLGGLLERDPARRFRHAADASRGLCELGEELALIATSAGLEDHLPDDAPTRIGAPSALLAVDPEEQELSRASSEHSRESQPASRGVPSSASWRLGYDRDASAPRLVGAGIGLYGLRPVPLVDREPERDAMWRALRLVAERRTARFVVLEGPSGCGKSRLAEWLCERAMETGAAAPLAVTHLARGGPTDGLGAMLARHLRVVGLERPDALARVKSVLEAGGVPELDEALALTELIAPVAERDRAAGDRAIRFRSARERHEVARRALHRLAADRPVLLWLDDVQWGLDALGFALYLASVQARSPSPILVVATVRAESMADRPAESELYAELLARHGVERYEVGPLAQEHWPSLVRELLGLEGELALRVEQRAAGNPLFAVELVRAWVEQGILTAGKRGFVLRPNARAELPEDLGRVWSDQVERVLAGRDDEEALALELAATLGQDVDAREWAFVCGHAGVAPAWGLVDALLDRRLARSLPDGPRAGWSFAHAMLREGLERRAEAKGRLAAHHRTCATLLGELSGIGLAARLGRHLLGCGDVEGAIGALLVGAVEHSSSGDVRVGLSLLADREEAMRRLDPSPADPRWGEGWAQLARLENQRGRLDEALAWATKTEEGALAHGWSESLAVALLAHAKVEQRRGAQAEAQRLCEAARQVWSELGDLEGVARSLHWLAVVRSEVGDPAAALELAEQSREIFAELGNHAGVADALYELGVAERRLGNGDRARSLYARASELYERAGFRDGVGNAVVSVGEIHRERGEYDEAELAYRRALAIYEAMGSGNALIARLNLGLALLGRGAYRAARAMFEETQPELERSGWSDMLGCSHVETLPCCAAARDWEGWDAHGHAAAQLLSKSDLADPDLAWAATLAGDLAREAGEVERARGAYAIAVEQLRRLGREAEATQLLAALD